MSFLSHWQPLRNEDAHTALVFGFLRHADPEHGLAPWVTSVLGRNQPVTVKPLDHRSFWPPYKSVQDQRSHTVPDLAFEADDGAPLLVVIEAKPWFSQHDFDQVRGEMIDAAAHTGQSRIALIMVGADPDTQPGSSEWETRLRDALLERGMGSVELELRYSSWARLGRAIDDCADRAPEWRRYADDVCDQLRTKGLLGYEGAPMIEDLQDNFTVVNAVKVFNRTMIAARGLVIAVTGHPQFQAAGFTPPSGHGAFLLARDTYSSAISQPEFSFTTTLLLCGCRKPAWPAAAGAYIAFDLNRDDEPYLQVGAYLCPIPGPALLVEAYGNAGEGTPQHAALADRDPSVLNLQYVDGAGGEWVCAERAWQLSEDHGEDDVRWVFARLRDAASIWDAASP